MATRRDRLLAEHSEQKKWIERCGGSLSGYIRHYGDPGVPPLDENGNPKTIVCPKDLAPDLEPVPGKAGEYYAPHFGCGGTAIWEADMGYLRGIESELRLLGR